MQWRTDFRRLLLMRQMTLEETFDKEYQRTPLHPKHTYFLFFTCLWKLPGIWPLHWNIGSQRETVGLETQATEILRPWVSQHAEPHLMTFMSVVFTVYVALWFSFLLRIVGPCSTRVEGAEAGNRVQMTVDTMEIIFQNMISVNQSTYIYLQ